MFSNPFKKSKQKVIIFTDSNKCLCNYYKNLIVNDSKIDVIHINDLDKHNNTLKNIKKNEKLIFFVHGDISKYWFYFNRLTDNINLSIPIKCNWWNIISNNVIQIAYFHACYGYEVISDCTSLNKIKTWIAYNNKIHGTITEDPALKKINKKLITELVYAVQRKNNLDSIINKIKSVHLEIISDMYEDDRKIDGFHSIIEDIGSNINHLKYSNG